MPTTRRDHHTGGQGAMLLSTHSDLTLAPRKESENHDQNGDKIARKQLWNGQNITRDVMFENQCGIPLKEVLAAAK